MGREADALLLDDEIGPGHFITASQISEMLDGISTVQRERETAAVPAEAATAGTFPVFHLRRQRGTVNVDVELAFPPALFPAAARTARAQIDAQLALVPVLRKLLERGMLKVSLRAPGTLAEIRVIGG